MRRAPALPMSLLRGLAALPAPPFLLLAMLMRGCWLVLAESIGQTAKAKRYSANAPTLTVRRAAHAKSRAPANRGGESVALGGRGHTPPMDWVSCGIQSSWRRCGGSGRRAAAAPQTSPVVGSSKPNKPAIEHSEASPKVRRSPQLAVPALRYTATLACCSA